MPSTQYGRKVGVGIGAIALLLLLLYVFPVGILVGVLVLVWCVMVTELCLIADPPVMTVKYAVLSSGQMALVIVGIIGMIATLLHGVGGFLLIGCIVMATDVVAQVVGRKWGRPGTFFPKLSPGKSRQGALAGWTAGTAVAVGVCIAAILGAPIFIGRPLALIIGVLLVVPTLAVAGDLYSSHLKRVAGVKDFAHYIPGTGGALDRLDSWLPVFALALLLL